MANAREIQNRIKSIQDTRKITNAMYLISSTKLKKSKKLLEDTEPYFYTLQSLIRRILRHMGDTEHPYFNARKEIKEEDRVRGLVVITGDKGLAGAYNHNVLKLAHEWMEKSDKNRLYVVGELGRQYFAARHVPVEEQFHYTVQNPTMHRARLIASSLIEDYLEGVDHLYADDKQHEGGSTDGAASSPEAGRFQQCGHSCGYPSGRDPDGPIPYSGHGPCGAKLCNRIYLRCPGRVILQ